MRANEKLDHRGPCRPLEGLMYLFRVKWLTTTGIFMGFDFMGFDTETGKD